MFIIIIIIIIIIITTIGWHITQVLGMFTLNFSKRTSKILIISMFLIVDWQAVFSAKYPDFISLTNFTCITPTHL